jgi:acetyl-CoA carboxylase biotin carboxyl carrier protein
MTEVMKPEHDEIGFGASPILSDGESQPRVLRIRAGEVHVEVEWPTATPAAGVPAPAARAFPVPEKEKELTVSEPVSATGLFDLCAPTVGTFYAAPEPGAAPFVREGDSVRVGQQIGIVEAMKLMIPIQADRDGQVVAVVAANGSPVEYGDRLFTFASTSVN